jgi:hypothetical protein
LSVIEGLDAQFLVEGIEDARDHALSQLLRADLLTGSYLERHEPSERLYRAQA